MSVPPYPTYADSGVEWIGPLPQHWHLKRLKHLARVQTGIAKGKDVSGVETVSVPYLRVANVQDGYIDLNDVSSIEVASGEVGRYLLRAGDVLMNEGGDFDKLGRGQVWQGEIDPCIHQNHVFAVRPHGVEPGWLALVTGAECGRFFFMSRAKQSTNLASISSTNLLELPVPCPPAEERKAIATFLERECGKIDALVAEQERLKVLLKAKRQAVISHAVTKGLNPNAKMKPSGIDWLGDVPEHWRVTRLKHVADGITVGVVVMPSQYYVDEGIPALRGVNVREMSISLENLVYFDEQSNQALTKSQLRTGDLVCVRTGKPGTTAIVGPELDGANCIDLIVIRRSVEFDPRFLAYAMNSDVCRIQYTLGSEGAMQQHFNVETAGNLELVMPAVVEQREIARFLDNEAGKIDELSENATRAITILRERRAALISAAVTGKIDVRGLEPAEAAA